VATVPTLDGCFPRIPIAVRPSSRTSRGTRVRTVCEADTTTVPISRARRAAERLRKVAGER